MSVLLGKGDGTFLTPVTFTVASGSGSQPRSVAIGDLNGDGKPDLVTANAFDATVSVLLGRGDGTFLTPVTYTVGSFPNAVAVEDLNGDGKPDLVTANGSGTVSVLLGRGDGTFQPQQAFAAGSGPDAVAIGDLNGDGKPDLVIANDQDYTVSVLLGNGDGTFLPQRGYTVGPGPDAVAIADLNGDGRPDLVTADFVGMVSVLLGNGDGTFQPQQTYPAGNDTASVAVGDVNGDGRPDLVTANLSDNTVSVLLNSGPCVVAHPSSDHMGVPLTLVGYNFGAQETVASYWDSIGRSPLTTATTDATGAFTAKTRVPQTPYGAHIISVGQSSGISFTTPFHVWPILALMPTNGPSGTPVIATGQGFGAAESVTLYWERVGGLVLGRTTTSARGGFTGSSAIHFTVPSAPPGSYLVCAYGHTTGAYRCRTFNATG